MNVATRHADRLPLEAYLAGVRHSDRPCLGGAAEAVHAIVGAGHEIARLLALGPLKGDPGDMALTGDLAGTLDQEANRIMASALQKTAVAVVNFEEVAVLDPKGSLAVAIDPLHGTGNIEANAPVGTIFSILPFDKVPCLGSGDSQIAAGFILYGAQTVMALTFGDGVHRFILDPRSDRFVRALPPAQVAEEAKDYAIDTSKRRYWDDWLRRYVKECELGSAGPRQRNLNLRWLENIVGEAWRILERGGVWMCPADHRPGFGNGAIRLCHEANPIAFLIEQAGGAATNGTRRILEIIPSAAHQHVPFVFGSRREVEHIALCQRDAERSHHNPLFGIKGLFRH